jgi:serine/threonine protein kinase
MEAPLPIAPTSVGDYTLGPLLGRGGMSEVYACTHATHGAVALKLLRDDADGAFHVESATREVSHPNVVRVIDAGLDPITHRYYIVMERLDGPDLATHLARPLQESEARGLFAQIADGMQAVHAHGIVHRDLKPANVMLHRGRPRIVDFGIAKLLGDNAALVTSRRIGTLGYMAPEQLVGGKIAPSVDVWALGVMLFEAVAGRLPFGGFSDSYTPQLVETAPRASSLAKVSPGYDALVAACLHADPAKRPPMAYVARALRGEVAVESATTERVTQDIGAMPVAPSSIASSSIAPSSIAPSSIAPSSIAPSSIAPSSSSSFARGRPRIVVGIAAALAAIVLIVVATARRSSDSSNATGSDRARVSGSAPATDRAGVSGSAPTASDPAHGSGSAPTASDPAHGSGSAPTGFDPARGSGPAPTRASDRGDLSASEPAASNPTSQRDASTSRAKPAARTSDRPATKSKAPTKRTTTRRRETLD